MAKALDPAALVPALLVPFIDIVSSFDDTVLIRSRSSPDASTPLGRKSFSLAALSLIHI